MLFSELVSFFVLDCLIPLFLLEGLSKVDSTVTLRM